MVSALEDLRPLDSCPQKPEGVVHSHDNSEHLRYFGNLLSFLCVQEELAGSAGSICQRHIVWETKIERRHRTVVKLIKV